MEQNEISQFESFGSTLTEQSKEFLREAAKWAYFLGIIGFIFIGFMVIGSFSIGRVFSTLGSAAGGVPGVSGGMIAGIYIAMALLYFFPVLYLFNFGKNMKQALNENDTEKLENGFKFLKSHYKFVGILTIVLLSFYALAIVGAIIGGVAGVLGS